MDKKRPPPPHDPKVWLKHFKTDSARLAAMLIDNAPAILTAVTSLVFWLS